MEQYVIRGGNPLVGEVEIGGAKNAALAILTAATMTDETVLIENLPDVSDINVLLEAIAEIGATVDRLDRWVSPVNILFFVLSGAELDLNILSDPLVLLIGVVYIAFRSLGKISGAFVSGRATHCSHNIQKYLGITLLPQAGVALGMAAEAAELSDGHMVRNVVLFSVLVYELVGPTLTKLALTAAGEIIPEGRTNARMANKPEFPVSLD